MEIPLESVKLVATYLVKPKMKLIDFHILSYNNLDWDGLTENPNALHLLEAYPDKLHVFNLRNNPNAKHMLETVIQDPKNIFWSILSRNWNTSSLFKQYVEENPKSELGLKSTPEMIYETFYWYMLSSNTEDIHLLEAEPDKIEWRFLLKNPNASIIPLLQAHPDMIDWQELSYNPNMSIINAFLESNPDKINWYILSKNPNAIHLLESNPDKINWYMLSKNPNAIHLLEANFKKICWKGLSENPNAIHLLEAVCLLGIISLEERFALESNKNNWTELVEKHNTYINWHCLSENSSVIHILELKNFNPEINWYGLLRNPNALHILKPNIERIDWYESWTGLCENPGIFEVDINQTKIDIIEKVNIIDKLLYKN